MRTAMRRMLGLGAVAAAGYAIWRAFEARKVDTGVTWAARPFPYPPEPETVPAPASWVDPVDGACPASHPVKAKRASGIYHVPGGASYNRTGPDRCYASPEAAEADGLRASKV